MIDHIWLRVNNIHKSKKFYEKLLMPLWYKVVRDKSEEWLVGFAEHDEEGKRDFWIKECNIIGEISSISCFAFKARNKQQVDEFYFAGIENWWNCNWKPWFRWEYHNWYYAAFILDPNGHNIEAVYDDL